jgi:hypothetical protein
LQIFCCTVVEVDAAGTQLLQPFGAIAGFANVVAPDVLQCVRDDPAHRRRIIYN